MDIRIIVLVVQSTLKSSSTPIQQQNQTPTNTFIVCLSIKPRILLLPFHPPYPDLRIPPPPQLSKKLVPSPDRLVHKLSKKWRRMREESARYKDTKANLDELELFLPEDLVAAVDETLDVLEKELEGDDLYAKANFEVFFATLVELMRDHARNNSPGGLAELDWVLEMTKRWLKEGMKTKSAVSIRVEDEKKGEAGEEEVVVFRAKWLANAINYAGH